MSKYGIETGQNPFDADSIPDQRRNVKENRRQKGGEFVMTLALIYIGAAASAACIMKIVEALDAPRGNRRRKA